MKSTYQGILLNSIHNCRIKYYNRNTFGEIFDVSSQIHSENKKLNSDDMEGL
jgi:hypothetical protein